MISVFSKIENIVGKGENVGNQAPFPRMFPKVFNVRVVKTRDHVVQVYSLLHNPDFK